MLGQRRFGKIQTALLVVIALVMGANLISPAVAHFRPKLGHLIKHVFAKADKRYYNVGEKVADADKIDGIDSASLQQKCTDGAILAYALVDGNGTATTNVNFSTNGVTQSYNCKGGPVEVRFDGVGSYSLRIPGITTVNPTTGVYLFQSADDHNDGIVNIDTHSGDDYIEVDTFEASTGAADNADFYLVALK